MRDSLDIFLKDYFHFEDLSLCFGVGCVLCLNIWCRCVLYLVLVLVMKEFVVDLQSTTVVVCFQLQSIGVPVLCLCLSNSKISYAIRMTYFKYNTFANTQYSLHKFYF